MLMPTFLRQFRNGRWFTWKEIKMIVYLNGWPHVLRRQAANSTITLLDHGPVFRLTRLNVLGPKNMASQRFDTWWDNMFKQWSGALDMIIWLDAPDAILLDRIRARDKWHSVKKKSRRDAYEFLGRYRNSYESVISALIAKDGPSLLRFDTDHQSLGKIADKVLAACNLGRRQG